MVPTATLSTVIAARARATPHAQAILAPDRSPVTYESLVQHMRSNAAALARAGFGTHSRIALAMDGGPGNAVALLCVMSCAAAVPLNPDLDAQAFEALLRRAQVDAIVTCPETEGRVGAIARRLNLPMISMTREYAFESDAPARVAAHERGDPGIALILHTSGTTGIPKIVPLTRDSQLREALHRVDVWQISSRDCCVCVTPLFTASALRRNLFPLLAAGGRVVCPTAFSGDLLYDWLSQYEPTFYAAGPAVHEALLEAIARRGQPPRHTLRYVVSSTTALPDRVFDQLEATLGVAVVQSYAMTEVGSIAQNPLPPGERRKGSVGRAFQGEFAVVDGTAFLPRGATGEIVVRGPQVFAGYENDADANAKAFLGDWFRTGDLGHVDADGYLYITGRVKELINRGGFKVSPSEVDAALLRHPAVKEAATCGMAHASLGEDVVAAVVLDAQADATPQSLRDFAFAHLAAYKVPSQIVAVDAIPRTPLGKVRRHELAHVLERCAQHPYEAPADERERAIAQAFADVLHTKRVGRFDNFFALGGDSLRSAQAATRICALLGCSLDAAALFRRATPAELAAEIAATQAGAPPAPPPILPLRRRAVL